MAKDIELCIVHRLKYIVVWLDLYINFTSSHIFNPQSPDDYLWLVYSYNLSNITFGS